MTSSSRTLPPTSARIRIRLLGPVSVEVDGSPLAVDTRKALALLAYLAVTRRPVGRDTLAALLWPEADGPGARGAFRRTLSVLRSGLGEAGLVVDRATIALEPSAVDVDLWRFEESLAVARGHVHRSDDLCPACVGALRTAADLDRGDFMAGFALRDTEEFEEWLRAEAASYRMELSAVLERLGRGEAAARAWDLAASAARRWLQLDPLHEPAHRLLMAILASSGEPAAALAQYRDCVRILDQELGVGPLAETSDLAEAIRAGRLASPRDVAASAGPDQVVPRRTPHLTPGVSRRREAISGPPLVGRDGELRALIDALDEVGPTGRLFAIEGEPGIGKTRLATAVADVVRTRGGVVLEARGYTGESAIPLGVVAELLRSGMGRTDAPGRLEHVEPGSLAEVGRVVPVPSMRSTAIPAEGDPFGRVRLFEALAAVLAALVDGPTPGLLWIDDLHLADASTVEFLGYLARRLRDHPLAMLLAWRVEDLEPEIRELILNAASMTGPATRVTLGRLDRSEVARLAGAVLGPSATSDRIDALFEGSEGLPLYVVEALAAPGSNFTATPGGVQALLRARIASVSEVGRQILAAAAVIGRSFDPALVRATSGRSDDETVAGLEELMRRGLVREVETVATDDLHIDFTHARLRDVAYEALSLTRRRLLHARVADVLTRSPDIGRDGRARWSLIAYHETLAGRTDAAAEAHRRAGEDARSIFANDEARVHLEAALALAHPDVVGLHAGLGEVLTLLGDYEGALFHLASAAALAGPESEALLEHRQGLVHARRGDWGRADRHLAAALASTTDPAMRSRILADRSAVADRSGDPDTAERLAVDALGLAQAVDDPVGIARSLDLLGILARRRGDLAVARAHLERALAIVDAAEQEAGSGGLPDPGVGIAALNTLALVLADLGDHERAIALTREALVRCERQGDRHRQAALENNLADLLHASGQTAEAIDHLKRAVVLFAEIGGRLGELEPEIWKLVEW